MDNRDSEFRDTEQSQRLGECYWKMMLRCRKLFNFCHSSFFKMGNIEEEQNKVFNNSSSLGCCED